jgi:Domain of unknown function (DUF4334)/GXWXG protein
MAAPPTVQEAQSKLQHIISSGETATPQALAPLWSALPPISVSQALGTYAGGLFTALDKPDPIRWFGKQIISETAVNPLLARAPANTTAAAGRDIVFPYPRANIAQARNVEHEGVVSMTIVYNRLPLMDYFRVVKEGDKATGVGLVLLGKSDLLGKAPSPAYFHLTRTSGVKIDFEYKNT